MESRIKPLSRSEKRHRIELAVEGWKRRAMAYAESTANALLAELLQDEKPVNADTQLTEVLDMGIAVNLRKNRIYRIGDVRAYSVEELLSIRGINMATIQHISDRLEPFGFRIGDCK